jgi:photosystem II stability/assembly factor-like uncharacterized protein
MKTILISISISILLTLCQSVYSQTGTLKIYSDDTTAIGLTAMNSFKVNGSNAKQIYIQRGINFPVNGIPNQSGRYLKLNRSNYTWYFPANGFLGASWCFCTCTYTCNPPRYVCNRVLNFVVSPMDTQLILKNRYGSCGCDAGDATYVTYNNGAVTNQYMQFSNDFMGIQNYGFDIDPLNDNIMYIGYANVGTNGRCIFKSTNKGVNWVAIDTNTFGPGILKINPLRTSQIFICGQSNMMMSTNSGNDFITLTAPWFSAMVFDAVDSSIFGQSYNSIYKSTNRGYNWSQVAAGNFRCIEISAVNHNILYAGSDAGLHRSVNGGATWSLYNDSFNPSKTVIGLSMDQMSGDTVYTATQDAVYKVWGGWTGITNLGGTVPQNYSLGQNYPNPFNPSTKFTFQIAKSSSVKLIIYDVTGKTVDVLINRQIEPGNYEVQWDAAVYPSGVYFYRLEAQDFVESRKMVLSK